MNTFFNALFACHRIPERSFFYRGRQFPICARCTGILIGYIVGILYAIIWGSISILFAFVLLIPLIIDGGVQYLGKWKSTNLRRFITGILAGVGTDFLLYGIVLLGFTHGRQLVQYFLMTFNLL